MEMEMLHIIQELFCFFLRPDKRNKVLTEKEMTGPNKNKNRCSKEKEMIECIEV
ncbi:uncharacterized protein G2W53_038232 [Senna tora]|uniref:Uncharacterized protein n=1 Tax=Senna tora TaxID=362788 RepID=A0A834SM50_9FABA|nr:uncharacterized protein G2W53_038232 [Senna tora]